MRKPEAPSSLDFTIDRYRKVPRIVTALFAIALCVFYFLIWSSGAEKIKSTQFFRDQGVSSIATVTGKGLSGRSDYFIGYRFVGPATIGEAKQYYTGQSKVDRKYYVLYEISNGMPIKYDARNPGKSIASTEVDYADWDIFLWAIFSRLMTAFMISTFWWLAWILAGFVVEKMFALVRPSGARLAD